MSTAAGELIPAATVIPLRDGDTGLEVLMLRKNSELAFGGMWVFPGGRVDPGDHVGGTGDDVEDSLTEELDEDLEVAAARRAAAREALEEADLLVDPSGMVPFSHWVPPEVAYVGPKRFATWFFVCRAPVGEAGVVTIDHGEIHDDEWVGPGAMIERAHAGEIQLAPPTIVTLHDLAEHDTVDAVLAAAAASVPERYVTRIGHTDEGMVTMWHGDAGYDSGDVERPGPRHRVVLGADDWRFERTP